MSIWSSVGYTFKKVWKPHDPLRISRLDWKIIKNWPDIDPSSFILGVPSMPLIWGPVPSDDFREEDNDDDELVDKDEELAGLRKSRLTLRLKLANSPI